MTQQKKYNIIAVDVSKKTLQVHCELLKTRLANSPSGFREIARAASRTADPLVVCEPTGGYERPLLEAMGKAGVPVQLADASQARSFALSQGVKAKSDPIDASMIHAFARQRGLQPRPMPSKTQLLVRDLLDRRSQLSEQAASEKARRDKCPGQAAKSIERVLKFLAREVARIESEVAKAIASDSRASRYAQAYMQVRGVGKVTAWSLIAYMPELGSANRRRIASLAGLAPHPAESGDWQGRRKISGGKQKLRKPLFMAATIAMTHNEHLKAFYQRLKAKGKPHKVCIVALMRKLLIHLQSIARKVELELA